MLITLTFDGALKRAALYKRKAKDKDKKAFRVYLASELPTLMGSIVRKSNYSNTDHFDKLERFANKVTKRHAHILKGKRFRIGNAQKFLNLYWKIAWLMKTVKRKPIHCPFDSIVIQKLPKEYRVSWTKFDSIEEYKGLVRGATECARGKDRIAEWELGLYLEEIKKRKS
jgi:hypothetical protein